ncbi:cytochrome P450 71D10-like [Actinidia eriantha]|uniref:cytochrome P450 71D10-like n=1 Tax=Actinidia eriantha TaxID=165200 RepID=UPI002585DDC1|nr:cytochrome P450 71D10-like [Actinidia eriantha]
MDFQFPSIPLLLACILFLSMVVKIVKKSKSSSSIPIPKLPPGPWKLPVIGNIHQLVGSLPHHNLRKLAGTYGPLMHLQLGQVSTMVVSSPEIAKEVLKEHDLAFAQRPFLLASQILSYGSTNIAFSPYGDYWRQMRKICVMELLSARRVQSFQGIREEEVLNLVKSISKDTGLSINLSKKISSLTYGMVARAAFGKRNKHQEEFISIVEEATVLAGGFSIVDLYPSVKVLEVITRMRSRLERLHKILDKILESIVNEHRDGERATEGGKSRETEDLVDVLLRVQKHGDLEFALTDDNIKAVILDMFTAGSETSSTTVEWAMSELIKNPQAMRRAQTEVRNVFAKKGNVDSSGLHELNYLNSVIKETLRLHPSAPLLVPRESSEQCVINGYFVPAKTKVIVNAWAIARDPKHWNEAERFYPERFLESRIDFKGNDFQFIPFGAGRRICPGMIFAVPNIELPLAQLLYHFDWKLPNGMKEEELDMEEAFGVTVRRKNELILIPIRYHDSLSYGN